VLLVEIRDVATQTVQDSATITLSADNAPAAGGGGGGGGGGSVSITDQSPAGNPTALYKLSSDGNVYDQSNALLEGWLFSGVAGDFQVRATLTSGTLTSGTTGSWLALSTSRSWSCTAPLGGSKNATLTIEIRDASSLTVLDSATVTLSADH
jgi:hypothetical protein